MTQRPRLTEAEALTYRKSSLLAMLTYRRPAGSKTEKRFIHEFISPLGTTCDGFGNHYLRIGSAPILWSCHTDTVHKKGGYQELKRVGECTIAVHDACKASNCLGADDTAGVWLMREMIHANVPGLYVFHREEEIGSNGSRWIAANNAKLLEGIKFAVALDRKGFTDVITHQGVRTCSDEFAKSMGAQLGMNYVPSQFGMFTDTKNYRGLIGECTNLSVGYHGAHSSSETLDGIHLFALRDKLISLDVNALIEKRKAGEADKYDWTYGSEYYGYPSDYWGGDDYRRTYGSYSRSYYGHTPTADESYWGKVKKHYGRGSHTSITKQWDRKTQTFKIVTKTTYYPKPTTSVPVVKPASVPVVSQKKDLITLPDRVMQGEEYSDNELDELTSNPHLAMETIVRNHPEEVADFLEQYGIDVSEIADHIQDVLGYIRLR
jgi:hypothetical protein